MVCSVAPQAKCIDSNQQQSQQESMHPHPSWPCNRSGWAPFREAGGWPPCLGGSILSHTAPCDRSVSSRRTFKWSSNDCCIVVLCMQPFLREPADLRMGPVNSLLRSPLSAAGWWCRKQNWGFLGIVKSKSTAPRPGLHHPVRNSTC